MTSISNISSNETDFPTEWHPLDIIESIECRQLSLDTFQLRDSQYIITLSKEGFTHYLEDSTKNFEQWKAANSSQISVTRRNANGN